MEILNEFDNGLKFTHELEVEGTIPFLDMLVCKRLDGSLYTDLYKKPSSSDRLLNYNSAHPLNQKMGVINTLALRIKTIVSPDMRTSRLLQLKEQLIKNSYPHRLVHLALFRPGRKRVAPIKEIDDCVELKPRYHKITFHPSLSERIKHTLKDFIHSGQICLAFYNNFNLGNLIYSNVKDPIAIKYKSNVVYKIVCECGVTYIGQTKQLLSERLKQHRYDARVASKKTGLSEHLTDSKHEFYMSDVKVLAEEQCYPKRLFLESSYVITTNNNVNKITDFEQMNTAFKSLLTIFHRKTKKS